MSLYNAINGYNVSCVFFLPMLGRKDKDYPRFRDCFLSDSGDSIVVLTRVGGPNRNSYYGEDELLNDENFIKTWDDDYDQTYGYYEFAVPDKWKSDFEKIKEGSFCEVSQDYKILLSEFYPKIFSINEKGEFVWAK